ncbi:MAG: thiamine pyrophosphate-binding protein [Alphaproteobacteria bacterium]
MLADQGLRSGGQVLVDQLRIHGVDTIFCVPGESYLTVIDALHDAQNEIKTVACRQEGGATNMAEAYGKLTGRSGVAMVTRGPGACNGSIGVHTAMQDSTPMVIFIGQVARDQEYREAFQEVDYHKFYGAICKEVIQIDHADRVPELVSQAFHVAASGRPGPVAVSIPEDMQRDMVDVADARPFQTIRPEVGPKAMSAFQGQLASAERPLMILGGAGWSEQACTDIQAFAERNAVPVAASFRCQDLFDNMHSNYAGELGTSASPALNQRMRDADLLIVVGSRLGEMTSGGYSLVNIPVPKQKLVHVYLDSSELGRVYEPDLAIVASMESFAAAARDMKAVACGKWVEWMHQANRDYVDNLAPSLPMEGVDMHEVMNFLNDRLPEDAIITTDAGNFSGWAQRFYRYRKFRTQLGPTSGAMGYSIPAAISARLTRPDRPVVCFVGDGGAMMSGQEIATAVQYGSDPIILILNNNAYGTIRMHQERDYPNRTLTTDLVNPDFAKWAQSFGAFGAVVERTEDFTPVFEAAMNAGRISVIEIRVDLETITTRTTMSKLRGSGVK